LAQILFKEKYFLELMSNLEDEQASINFENDFCLLGIRLSLRMGAAIPLSFCLFAN